ncbi:hypothetical protein [Streptomyces sp. WMMB 322]|uniref:hypothetical protein n=1 Tax=Streptomyces sp. WMMB 322 TaxID=1286821 RepID=UPI0006E2B572|nr:hypothetical protein [Streptomyces sp. WMMB 322]SCK27171.1 hypothetical protein H180DRAFT_02098 [Streptomyces sp. WMMB 322]
MSGSPQRRNRRPAEWKSRVAAPWMLIGGGLLAIAFLVLASLFIDRAYVFLGLLAAAVALLAVGWLEVSVTGREVAVRSVLAPPLRRRVPLTKVTEASAKHARPMELGGWGFRRLPKRSAVSLRAGDALWLRLESGRDFVITVDDAARAARVVNGNLTAARQGSR